MAQQLEVASARASAKAIRVGYSARLFRRHLGWICLADRYDDDGVSGLSLDRPALKRLLADIQDGKIDHLTIYYLDRLTRSSSDLAKLLAIFEKHGVTLSSVPEHLGD